MGVDFRPRSRFSKSGAMDDSSKRHQPGRSKSKHNEEHEVRYWTANLHATKGGLQKALDTAMDSEKGQNRRVHHLLYSPLTPGVSCFAGAAGQESFQVNALIAETTSPGELRCGQCPVALRTAMTLPGIAPCT